MSGLRRPTPDSRLQRIAIAIGAALLSLILLALSGGNQQKVILARELERQPRIIVAAEPTRGLDIESTRFIHDELRAAAGRGAAILLITSDLDEAFALGDAIHVIYRGTLSARLTPGEAAVQAPMLMAGVGSRESGAGA